MTAAEYDTNLTDSPVCPYCGYHEQDAWEIDFGGAEGSTEADCARCGRTYFVSRQITSYYNTKRLEP